MTGEADERTQIERAIAAQEKLRGVVDDAIVDLTLSSLRSRLNALDVDGSTSSAGNRAVHRPPGIHRRSRKRWILSS